MTRLSYLFLLFSLTMSFLVGCEGCEEEKLAYLKLPYTDNFDRAKLGEYWYSGAKGRWYIKNNRLCVEDAKNEPLFLKLRLPHNVKVEFDAWAMTREGDVKIEIFNDGFHHATGYVLIHGGWFNSLSIIDRLGEHNRTRRRKKAGAIIKKKHHWTVIRRGDTLHWSIDGKPFIAYKDKKPLSGKGYDHFAFSNWKAHGCYDNLSIERLDEPKVKAPQKRVQIKVEPEILKKTAVLDNKEDEFEGKSNPLTPTSYREERKKKKLTLPLKANMKPLLLRLNRPKVILPQKMLLTIQSPQVYALPKQKIIRLIKAPKKQKEEEEEEEEE